MQQSNHGFVIGVILGFVGGCIGVVIAPLFGREYLNGAVVGFGLSVVTSLLLGGFVAGLGQLVVDNVESTPGGFETTPVQPGELRRVNPDGTPAGSGGAGGVGLPLGWLAVAAGTLGLSVAAFLGAAYALLAGGSSDDDRGLHPQT
jgi:hypothetical protein